MGSNGVWGGFLHRFENWWWLVVWLAGTSCGGGLMVVGLSHSISTSLDLALSPSSLSNRPLFSEGWVPMWVYSGVSSDVG